MSIRRPTSSAVKAHYPQTSVVSTALASVVGVALAVLWASSAFAASEACPNAVFRTGIASRLPDCRAYEMVTPPYKEGFAVFPIAGSVDGSVLLGESIGVFAGTQNDLLIGAHYTFSRGSSAWVPAGIEPPAPLYPYSRFGASSSDGGSSLWFASTQSQDAGNQGTHSPIGVAGDFLIRRSDGSLVDVGPRYPLDATAEDISQAQEAGYIEGASGDLSSVFFTSTELHWPGDPTHKGIGSLYEYVGTGNSVPLLVGVSGGFGSESVISKCGTTLERPNHEGGTPPRQPGVISAPSGSSVFFTALACGSSPSVDELLARVDNGSTDAHTVAISEPGKSDCEQCDTEHGALQNAEFRAASADGSKVFFTTKQPLLGGDATNNLYEYDFDNPPGDRIVRVSGGDSTVLKPAADVREVDQVSSDGSFVYFVALGVLTTVPNSQGQVAEVEHPNLYMFERDAHYPNGHTAFITSGSSYDGSISPNGRFFTFGSSDHLTLDDTSSFPRGFEYDAQTGALVRFTIGQNGYNNNGNSGDLNSPEAEEGGGLREGTTPTGTEGALGPVANDGAVFFTSAVPLTEGAAHNSSSVYEYRQGNVYLISPSQNRFPAELIGVDATGTDVFFSTRYQILPQDGDTQQDVYDARVGGGFPSPIPPSSCEGDGCQGGLSGAPVLLSPGSQFQAGGNPPLIGTGRVVRSAPKAKGKRKPKKKPKKKQKGRGRKAVKAGRASGRLKGGGK